MTPSIGDPVGRVGYVEYGYDDAGNLESLTNWDKEDPGTRTIIAQDEYDYDARGSLLKEWQSIGDLVGAGTPKIAYSWAMNWAKDWVQRNASTFGDYEEGAAHEHVGAAAFAQQAETGRSIRVQYEG